MWHSQESVWNLMERNAAQKHYARVAMLRSDVVYMTPLDIYEMGNQSKTWDYKNSIAVVPRFARYPVNDRMIYGPYDAVKIWAAGRFSRLNRHAVYLQNNSLLGEGIHSERFLKFTIFPAIRKAGVRLQEKEGLCFLRVRSDHSIRFSDCGKIHVTQNNHKAVERILQRPCHQNWTHSHKSLIQLDCPPVTRIGESASVILPTTAETHSPFLWHSGCDPTLPRKMKNPPKKERPKKFLLWRPQQLPPPTRPPCIEKHASMVAIAEAANKSMTKQTNHYK